MRGPLSLLSLVVLAACADWRGPGGESVASSSIAYGQDPIALRVARGGGLVRAYHYPRLDSLIWSSTQPMGAQSRVLAFDPENGLEAVVDRNGVSGWVDLRIGTVKPSGMTKVVSPVSTDAWSIYAISRDTIVQRATPGGDWQFTTRLPVHDLFPLLDGGLVVVSASDSSGQIIRLRPPEAAIADSLTIPPPDHAVMSPLGDRLYLAFGHALAALNTSTLDEVGRVSFDGNITAMVTTPSGDRLFVANEGSGEVALLDRYSGEETTAITLPRAVRDLRMDPLGRLLLIRPDSGDSIWVVAVATNRVVATMRSAWRADLPTVAPDGSVATVPGRDVHFTMPGQAKARIIVRDGAAELWNFVYWNGFRPRAPGLDQPVVFPVDSVEYGSPVVDSGAATPRAAADSAPPRPPEPKPDTLAVRPAAVRTVWTVQVAAVLSEDRAKEVAKEVRVEGLLARVVASTADGVRIFRVVMGPFPSKEEADRIGRLSGKSYWVFEGVP